MRKARLGIAACLALGVAFGSTAWLIAMPASCTTGLRRSRRVWRSEW